VIRGATDVSRIGTRYRSETSEAELAAERDQRVTATSDGGFRFVRTIRYADRPFGTIDVVVDEANLEAAARNSRDLLIGLGIALLLVVLALSYAIGRTVARPVERLRRAMKDAANGNRDARISH